MLNSLIDNGDFRQLRDDLEVAFYQARRHKVATKDEAVFEINLAQNLRRLAEDIYLRVYEPSAGIAFINTSPSGVAREIYAAPFRDRVVHHYICGYVMEWWDRHLQPGSASCRKGKGALYAIRRLARQLQSASDNYLRPIYVYKGDLQGFFMSLPRNKLLERARWGLRMQFPGDKPPQFYHLDFAWEKVLMHDPTKTVRYRGSRADWAVVPSSKILSYQPPGKGIVIGNLTSQLASNFYLDQLDRFVKFELGCDYYGRYVDDFYIIFPANELDIFMGKLEELRRFTEYQLQLKLHPRKCKIHKDLTKGVPFLGAVVYPHRIVAGRCLKGNYYRAAAAVANGRKTPSSLMAYEGLLLHYNSRALVKRLYQTFDFELDLRLSEWSKKATRGH